MADDLTERVAREIRDSALTEGHMLTVTPDHAEMALLHALSAFGLDSDDPIDPVRFAKVYVATLTRGATIVVSEDGPPLTYGRHPFVAKVQAGINDPDNLVDADQEHEWLIEAIEIIDRLSSDRDADAQAYFRGYREELAVEIEGLSPFPLMGRSAQTGYRLAIRRAAGVVRRSGAGKS